jgi:hypothetical protein
VQVANGRSRDTNEVLVIRLHMVGKNLSMDLSSRHLRTYEAKRTEEQLYSFAFILYPSHFFSLSFFSSSFFYFIFFSSFFLCFRIFSFAPHNFCNIILTQQWSEMM